MEQLTVSQKIELGTKEITRRIREQLKQDFKDCTFSVSFERYSGGSTIRVALMKSKIKIIKDFKDISERALEELNQQRRHNPEQVKELQSRMYHQLNQYCLRDDYDEDNWNNGVFLTKEGHELFQKVNNVIKQYHYDHSEPQTDYFNVNFYYDIHIGKWDKPFEQEV